MSADAEVEKIEELIRKQTCREKRRQARWNYDARMTQLRDAVHGAVRKGNPDTLAVARARLAYHEARSPQDFAAHGDPDEMTLLAWWGAR